MQTLSREIEVIIGITLLLLLITSFVVVFVLINRNQHHKYLQDKEETKNAFLQEILKAQLEVKEKTLHTISQEIHDNIGQILSLVKLNLNTILLEDENPAAIKIITTKELVGKAIQDLRNLSKSLNTEHIIQKKLSESLKLELDLIQRTGIYTTQLQIEGTEELLDPQKQIIIFRIVQEVLQNIIKHAKAQYISVVLNFLPNHFIMSIKDDGTGFDVGAQSKLDSAEKGTGLSNIYHRAKLMGADLSIDSHLGQGTLTRLSLPINV